MSDSPVQKASVNSQLLPLGGKESLGEQATNGSNSGVASSEKKEFTQPREIPDRYLIKELNGSRVITCFESPNIAVHIERGQTATPSAARKSLPGTIYLDGAAQGAPFLEHEKMIYNLDHHEGCIRSITYATCEQAMIMIMKGLDLRKREWKIYSNDPDLDTMLAIWIMLNHLRLREADSRARRTVMPLIRLEGAIDAHGLEFKGITGFSDDLLNRTSRILDSLTADELQLKKEGSWNQIDFTEYGANLLRRLDQIVYRAGEFSGFQEIEELAQLPVYYNRIAVVCTSNAGIYETEMQLKKLYGTRLALIMLQKGENNYTLRQTDLFLPSNLEDVYGVLNIYDSKVTGHNPGNRWGGSTDIGGSPRQSGTSLAPRQILDICHQVFQGTSFFSRVKNFVYTLGASLSILGAGWLARFNWNPRRWFGDELPEFLYNPGSAFMFAVSLLSLFLLLGQAFSSKRFRFYGIQAPVGWTWLLLYPIGIIIGAMGGAWIPWIEPGLNGVWTLLIHIVFMTLAAETLFRGLVHGMLIQGNIVQSGFSRWFISRPVILSGLLYAFVFLVPYNSFIGVTTLIHSEWGIMVVLRFLLSFLFGVICGVIRERAESIFASYFLHIFAVVAGLYLYRGVF